jgi:hypothetical protein
MTAPAAALGIVNDRRIPSSSRLNATPHPVRQIHWKRFCAMTLAKIASGVPAA